MTRMLKIDDTFTIAFSGPSMKKKTPLRIANRKVIEYFRAHTLEMQ